MAAGERIVIARLVIDEQGAVVSVNNVIASQKKLGDETKKTSDIFTARMFNMKTAAAAFLGTFTLAGGVLAFKSFVTSILESQENFKAFSEAASKTSTSLSRMLGDLTGVNQALGDTATILGHVGMATDASHGASGGWLGVAWNFLWGTTPVAKIEQLLHLTAQVADKVKGPVSTPATPVGSPPNLGQPTQNTRNASAYQLAGSPYAPAAIKLDVPPNTSDSIRDFANTVHAADLRVLELGEHMNGSRDNDGLPSMFEALGEKVEDVSGRVQEASKDMGASFQIAAAAAQTFGDAMAASLFQAGKSAKEALGEALMGLAQTMTAWALASLAMAAISTTGWGAAATGGTPHQFLHAAAAFGIAAAGAYATASALGATRGGGAAAAGAGGGGYAASPAIGGGGPSYNITNYIEGTSNPDAVARKVVLYIKRATADGAGGGFI